MARPLLSSTVLRDSIDLYLNAEERRDIEAKAQKTGLPLSTFIRRSALGQKVEAPPGEFSLKRWQELARTTANLNQISKALNEGRATGIEPAVIDELAEQVRLLRLELLSRQEAGE